MLITTVKDTLVSYQYAEKLKHISINVLSSKYLIVIFTHLQLCLAEAIHNFKWVKIRRFPDIKSMMD